MRVKTIYGGGMSGNEQQPRFGNSFLAWMGGVVVGVGVGVGGVRMQGGKDEMTLCRHVNDLAMVF
jgi:hypothetical protein